MLVYVCRSLDLDFQSRSIFRVEAFSDWDNWTFLLAMCENMASHTMLTLLLLSRHKGSMRTQIKILPGASPLTVFAAILLQDGLDEFSKEKMICMIMNDKKGFHEMLFLKADPSVEKKEVAVKKPPENQTSSERKCGEEDGTCAW